MRSVTRNTIPCRKFPSFILNFFSYLTKMASSTGKWEVVGKDGKARKNTTGNKKNKTKVNEADLPKLDIKGQSISLCLKTAFIQIECCTLEL